MSNDGDWYDEILERRRKQREKADVPDFYTGEITKHDRTAPWDAASRYLEAMGEKRTDVRPTACSWSCGCVTHPPGKPFSDAPQREYVGPVCAKHRGKVARSDERVY